MTVAVPGTLLFDYSGDGVTTSFAYTNFVHEAADLVVVLEAADGTQTIQTLGTHYTVTGAGTASASANFLTAPPSGSKVYVFRDTAKKQTVDLEDGALNPANTTETQLDRLARITQDLGYHSSRALKLAYGALPIPAGHFPILDQNGNVVDGGLASDLANAGQAAADAIQAKEDAEAARDAANAAAVGLEHSMVFTTKAVAEGFAPISAPEFIRTSGFSSVGDFGGALYRKVVSEPSHPGKIQIASGEWYEIAEPEFRPEMFGAVGDNSTDDHQAIQNCWNALPTAGGTILLRRRYRVGSPLDFAGKNSVTIRGMSSGNVSTVGAALNFYAGGDSTFANAHACVFRNIQTLNLEDFQFQWTNPASGGSGPNVANRKFLVVMDRVSFPSWRRVRGIPLRTSGGPNPINPICGAWYRAGQTWRMSECQWTGFGGRHVMLQSAGDPAVSSALVREISNVQTYDSGNRTLVTLGSALTTAAGDTFVINNVAGHTALNGEWTPANVEVLSTTQIAINVPYAAGWSSGGYIARDAGFYDQTRRPDVAEHERCRFAGADDLAQSTEAYAIGPWSGSVSLTDCIMIFAKHALRVHNHIYQGVSPFPNPDTTSAPGFVWLSGKGGEGMTGHCVWLEAGNHVRCDNVYFGTYKSGVTEGNSLRAESTFLGPLMLNGVYFRAAPQHGVYIACRDVTITGGAIGRHGTAEAGLYDNIHIASTAAEVVITGVNCSNLAFTTEPYANTRYAINSQSTNHIVIVGNNVRGNTAGLNYTNGPNVEVQNNTGYRTRSFGRSAFTLSSDTHVIPHGLPGTPTVYTAQLEVSGQEDRFVRLKGIDTTNITISIWDVSSNAFLNTGTFSVMWTAEL